MVEPEHSPEERGTARSARALFTTLEALAIALCPPHPKLQSRASEQHYRHTRGKALDG